ncbi:MAG TPA: Hsp20/alpha crystallin family protein [Myxococcota bacterium]|nr:Hsp20/alpha crystallin family protein [Myxococcota bacterium]
MAEKQERETKSLARWDPFEDLEAFARWSPFRELARHGRLSRFVEELFGERSLARGEHTPALDIHEGDTEYVVTVELPGVRKEDVSVEVTEGVLSVRGEKTSGKEEKKERSRWVERIYGSFHRAFTLPANAASDRIDASFKDGVLTVRIPKLEQTKPKTVAVK